MSIINPVPSAAITQGFGFTGLGSNGAFLWNYTGAYYPSGFHTGIDLSAASGSTIYNVDYGVVYVAAWDGCGQGSCWGQGGGYVAIVKHNTWPFFSSHAHMNGLFVSPGQPVYRGQPLGRLDTMGYATGPHDHHSVWLRGLWPNVNNAYPMDPRWYWPGGARANYYEGLSAKVRVSGNEPLRQSPGLTRIVRQVGPAGAQLPYFYSVHGPTVSAYGITSNLWRLVWSGRFCWAWAPRTSQLRTSAPTREDREEVARSLGIVGPDGQPIGGQSHAKHAPGADLYDHVTALEEPRKAAHRLRRDQWWKEHERTDDERWEETVEEDDHGTDG
jgi:hypothetical protein